MVPMGNWVSAENVKKEMQQRELFGDCKSYIPEFIPFVLLLEIPVLNQFPNPKL